jgi:hypothetical protein
MEFYRTKSKLHISSWDEKKLIILELTPALPNNSSTIDKGSIRYNKNKKINISFSVEESFKAAFCLHQLALGQDIKYQKMADTSKIAGAEGGEIKSLSFIKGQKGGVLISLKAGDNSVSTVLGEDEAYALAKYFELSAAKYIHEK